MNQELLTDVALKVLKELKDKIPQGCFIGKLDVSKEEANISNQNTKLFAEVLKTRKIKEKQYFLCAGQALNLKGELIKIRISLMQGNTYKENNEEKAYIEENIENENKYVFQRAEVESFCNLTGDDNYIHKGTNIVVPGMLILHRIERRIIQDYKILVNKISAEFYLPIYAEEEIYIKKELDNLRGYYEGKKCFQIRYEGEK